MLVSNWMSGRLVTVGLDDPLNLAAQLLVEHQIRRLPVVGPNGELAGIITDRDLRQAGVWIQAQGGPPDSPADAGKKPVKIFMSINPVSVEVYDTIDQAALTMLEKRISGLPVLDEDGKVCSVITQTDVFRAMVTLTGVLQGGVHLAMDLPDVNGTIAEAGQVLRRFDGRIVSILSSYDRVAPGRRKVFFRVSGLDRGQLNDVGDALARVGVLLYIVDSEKGKAELVTMQRRSTS